jgi:DNA-binding NtrC family response regulator
MSETLNPNLPIVIVDDDPTILSSCTLGLRNGGFTNLKPCEDSRCVLNLLRQEGASLVLMDLQMPHVTGEELLPQIVQEFPGIPVIVVTGSDTVETGVQCMKLGAFDFLTKPVDMDRILTSVKQALSFAELSQENRSLREYLLEGGIKHPEIFSKIVTNNPAMRAIFQYIESIAPTAQPVLITGETGAGKELLARAVHDASRRKGEFVAVNVAGVEESVFSDTLFGHIRGAFTGADTVRAGLVERSAGGTLFLDEIGDLSLVLQTRLLRLIQEREYFPLGSDFPKKTDARIVVATNHDFEALQSAGKMRKDLYYRLCSHRINIPPLRRRLDDIPLLLDHFLADAAAQLDRKVPHYPKELRMLLNSYNYPGNIRELQAIIFDALSQHTTNILSMDVFKERILGVASGNGETEPRLTGEDHDTPLLFGARLPTIEEAKDLLIREAMKRAGGNKTLAASILGVSRQALNLRERRDSSSSNEVDS